MNLGEALRILGPEKAAGDRELAAEVLRAKIAQLVRAKGTYPAGRDDADDAVQRVLLRMLRRLRPLQGDAEGVAASYLRSAVDHDFADQLKRKRTRTKARPTAVHTPTALDADSGEDHPDPVIVDPVSPEEIAAGRAEAERIQKIFLDQIVAGLDARNPQGRGAVIVAQLQRIARGETTVEEIIEAEGGDFTKARNRFYQNVHRLRERIAAEIDRCHPDDRPALYDVLERLKIQRTR